jgi:hypothetical protein
MHISQNSLTNNTRRMRGAEGKKKESHPLQDYCKSFEAAETLQRRKKIQEPQDRREFYSQPIHSRTGFNPSESKCAPTSSPPPPSW